jgi:diguanylate cyclase (GGDEF)-like protein
MMPLSELIPTQFPHAQPAAAENGYSSPFAREQLEEEIAQLEMGWFRWLRLAPGLEDAFEAATVAVRTRRMWIEGLCCVVLFNCFLVSDYIFFPHTFSHFLTVRLGIATPPAIVVLMLLRRGVSRAWRESLIVLICAIFGLSFLYLYFDVSPVISSYALTDLAILVLFTNVGIRIRLPYAIFAAAMCLVFGTIYLRLDSMLSAPEKLESLAILMAAVLLSLIGNYSIERGDRLNFLMRLRSEVETGVLANANDRLLTLAREDALTGLANRGYFDEAYEGLWTRAVLQGAPLSVIMIDIDNFKLLNDRYGHPYGDAVLKRVAILLKESLRNDDDFVARYGGEEFIVVLPDSSARVGWRVAERIRVLIEIAGNPAVGVRVTDEHGWGTVSCGVATIVPQREMESSELIAIADTALYQAKAEGRNRVCAASMQT